MKFWQAILAGSALYNEISYINDEIDLDHRLTTDQSCNESKNLTNNFKTRVNFYVLGLG